ncbi:hypothetical protein SAMN05421853_104203 [Roseivivax halotolerans]|uniref:Uncharacterized protein n=1 Tax=Roseivivax halotolerans TaxID=93684 RepID=A0A1I5XY68_9RHOB|nr:hypothetical protein [Roseivivax halotolerans]SFQ36677.1 hypothetical protein SAMN05421853_104203 [Roseivivax halotolerans]
MTTSAEQLNFILSQVSGQKNRVKERVLTITADLLEISGDERELFALSRLQKLIRETKSGIEQLPFEEAQKKQLRGYIAPFSGIENFTQSHATLETAKNNFLKPENLVNLTNIHFALAGRVEKATLPSEASELAEEFRSLKGKLPSTSIPDNIKKLIAVRIDQSIAILENSQLFDPEDLQLEIEALTGSVVVNGAASTTEDRKFFGWVAKACVGALAFLGGTDLALGRLLSIHENANKFIEIIDPEE